MNTAARIPAAVYAGELIAGTAAPVTDRWEVVGRSPERLRADLYRLLEAAPTPPRVTTEACDGGPTMVGLTAHPATWDRGSSRQLTRMLTALLAGTPSGLLAAASLDAATSYLDRAPDSTELRYWREELAGLNPVELLPGGSGGLRPARRHRIELSVPEPGRRALVALARHTGQSRYTCALAVSGWYSARWSASRQVLLGYELDRRRLMPAAGRTLGALTDGLLVPVTPDHGTSFGQLVSTVAKRLRRGLRHAGALVTDAAAAAGEPLAYRPRPADIAVAYHRRRGSGSRWPVWHADLAGGWPLADLQLTYVETSAGLVLRVEYDEGMAPEDVGEFARGLSDSLVALAGGTRTEAVPIAGRVPALAAGPPPVLPLDFLDRIEQQGRQRPQAPAIVCGGTTTGYADLLERSRRVAGWLRSSGVDAGDVVALALPRDADAVAVMLGVARIGAAYAPLDPAAPAAWTQRQLALLRPAALVRRPGMTHLAGPAASAGVRVLQLPRQLPEALAGLGADGWTAGPGHDPGAPAYVLFTSGSTGAPKGVSISRRALSAYLDRIVAACRIRPTDRLLGFAKLTFDVSAFDILASLAAGASCHMVDEVERGDPARLQRLLERDQVTVAKLPPALLPHLAPDRLPRLRLLAVGGESFPDRTVAPWRRAGREVVQTYGPTETTVGVTAHPCQPARTGQPPLGGPMPGNRIVVLDSALWPVPRGAVGEICIGGDQVAIGYHRQPAPTADRFIPDPAGGGRLYRTGDLGRWNQHGQLEFLGRIDWQIQVRGVRVEPAEVEEVLAAADGVGAAAVVPVAGPNGAVDRLMGFVVGSAEQAAEQAGVLEHARRHLPAHAVPARVEVVERLPVTGSGKLDRAALARWAIDPGAVVPPPLLAEVASGVIARLPDRRIAGVLDLELAIRLAEEVFGITLAAADVLREPTAAGLAGLVGRQRQVRTDEAVATELSAMIAAL